MQNYFYTFRPLLKETLWGGHEISRLKGLAVEEKRVGESWEISGIPGSESLVSQGPYAGYTLSRLIEAEGEKLLGKDNFEKFETRFPLLVKFIDAAQDLSIQVHPDDALAQVRHQSLGKSEMWYVMHTAPGAYLLNGFDRAITPAEYEDRVHNQTLPQVLNRYEVQFGDVFYLPAGRVHSLGAGCLVAEIQQSSDITYRIYDYGRTDKDGRPRQLHLEEARDAIDYSSFVAPPRIEHVPNGAVEIVRSPYFTTSLYTLTESITCDYSALDSFVILICTSGSCTVQCADEHTQLLAGNTLLIAACADQITLVPDTETRILECFV